MSMTGELYRVDSQRLNELLENHERIEAELFPGDYPANHEKFGCSVEKTWNAIEFILDHLAHNGRIPWISPLTGGQETGAVLHYGPVWYRTANDVRIISTTLSGLTKDEFRQGYLPQKMHEQNVYPSEIWRRTENDTNFEYVWGWYRQLTLFYVNAAKAGDAVLLFLG